MENRKRNAHRREDRQRNADIGRALENALRGATEGARAKPWPREERVSTPPDSGYNTNVNSAEAAPEDVAPVRGRTSMIEIPPHRQRSPVRQSTMRDSNLPFFPSGYRDPSFQLSTPFSVKMRVGPKGGRMELLGCRLYFPPNAFKTVTVVKIIIRSIYDDALDGYLVISPEFECSTRSGISFEGIATISLPVHSMPESAEVTVVTKQNQSSAWEVMDVNPTVKERLVTFQVSHFTIYKLLSRIMTRQRIRLSHNMYFKPSVSQLLAVTCVDDEAVKKGCSENLKDEGFKISSPLPDLITLCQDDVMSYRYFCTGPGETLVQPTVTVVLKKSDFKTTPYATRRFMLEPSPGKEIHLVAIRYVLSTPQGGKEEQRIGLEWKPPTTGADAQITSEAAIHSSRVATRSSRSRARDNRPLTGTRRLELGGANVRDLYILDGSTVDSRRMPSAPSTSRRKADNS